ncbi:MAG: SAM-dependent chlorinase/fluorinase [Bacteroidales bacterium]|nr:SAM-dependent chlorinase/fluorinase [Bacteroidales bacterium]MBR5781751.1 SAM-dependent chlorinase/fluorinase [Bacteroidales bacterium]
MAIITLTSDWGLSGYYVPSVKGAIYSALPNANIVDISHEIEPFDIRSAAFIIKNCYNNFPKGTIHIIAVDTEESSTNPHIVVKYDDHYFIGTDNSIFSLIIGQNDYEAVTIEVVQDTDFFTFSTRDRFVKVAVMIHNGVSLSDIGGPYDIKERIEIKPSYTSNEIHGLVNYIDNYENLITNIPKSLFDKVRGGRNFTIKICSGIYKINEIRNAYQEKDVQIADLIALFGTHGFLEIAMNRGKASSLLGMERDSAVDIYFEETKTNTAANTLF